MTAGGKRPLFLFGEIFNNDSVITTVKPRSYQLPPDRQVNKFDRGFPSVDDG